MGEATWQIAKANPAINYLGVEVHMPGVGKLMAKLNEYELTNVRLIERDVFEVFHFMISDGALDGVHLYFPDPWPKKRHNKRRIVNQRFISEVARKLKPGGYLTGGVIDRPESRPLTRFEGQGLTKDQRVTDFLFRT
jgi:tRNA (guanine-N7-)-methyltransferase